MAERFAGKTALVTGGGAGIGRATVQRLVAEGCRVVVLERDPDAAVRIAEETGASAHAGDATREADVAAALALAGPLDVLVNNAGGTWAARFDDCPMHKQ